MKILHFIKNNFKWLVLITCISLFLIFTEDVIDSEIESFDIAGYNLVRTYLISDFATPIAKFITNFGGVVWLIGISIVLFIVIKNKKIGITIPVNLLISAILNFILKNIFQRPRPVEYRIINGTGYSFPSGHSMVSMAFYGFLMYLIYKNIKNKYIKWVMITILGILSITIGISRIYLGVHYTSDVIGGFLMAIVYLIIYINIIKNIVDCIN